MINASPVLQRSYLDVIRTTRNIFLRFTNTRGSHKACVLLKVRILSSTFIFKIIFRETKNIFGKNNACRLLNTARITYETFFASLQIKKIFGSHLNEALYTGCLIGRVVALK